MEELRKESFQTSSMSKIEPYAIKKQTNKTNEQKNQKPYTPSPQKQWV